jgi:hypothetical protein
MQIFVNPLLLAQETEKGLEGMHQKVKRESFGIQPSLLLLLRKFF